VADHRRIELPAARPRMSEAEIKAVVDRLADVARVLRAADPDDKAEIFRQLGLRLTYHPSRQLVQARIEIPHWQIDGVREGLEHAFAGNIPSGVISPAGHIGFLCAQDRAWTRHLVKYPRIGEIHDA
jgi:hypothetical protein